MNKTYTWNYAVEGIFTFMPLYITVEAETEKEAKDEAIVKIQSTHGDRKITFFTLDIK
jgi:hypothetical protein